MAINGKCFNYATAGDCAVNYANAEGVLTCREVVAAKRPSVQLLTCLLDWALTGLSIMSTRDFTLLAFGHQSPGIGRLLVPTGGKVP